MQRRRWANGGLLILPKFIRQVRDRRARGERVRATEIALRVNYMASIAWATFGLVFLLAYPYDSRLLSGFVVLAALPYFITMGLDLRATGYKFSDVLRIYGFNLILLPVNFAGVLKSVQQAVTLRKIPFSRTPKVKNRTAAPLLHVVVPYVIVAFSLFTLWRDVVAGNWINAAFAGFNAVVAVYAIISYIGIINSIVDVWHAAIGWLFVPVRRGTDASAASDTLHWRDVLYTGTGAPGETPSGVDPRELEKSRS